jgi:hypothetical protein
VACVEPDVDLVFCHCVLLDEAMGSWENFVFFCLFYKSLYCFKVRGCVFVLKCGSFFCQ